MKQVFALRDGRMVQSDSQGGGIVVYASPDESEKRQLLETVSIDPHTLESALDPDEVSRVEFVADQVFIIWKRPNRASFEQRLKFEVSSAGLFLGRDRLTVILADTSVPFGGRDFENVSTVTDVVLQFMLHTIRHFLDHLKAVKRLTADLQARVNRSMGNEHLIHMFDLGESLTYYLNALEANGAVLTKLRTGADKLGLSPSQLATLDDIVVDHQQCVRQTQIYSSVLSGLMDARGNIVNNNMNILLKNLTLINVVFLPLNLVASIGGMSEFSNMTKGMDWRLAYSLFMVGMLGLGWLTWVYLVKRIDKGELKS